MMGFVNRHPAAINLNRFEISYSSGSRPGPLTLELGPGERLGLASESGCGKTTLLEHLAGLPRPGTSTSGQCQISGPVG